MDETKSPTLREYAAQAIQPRLERMLSHLEGAKKGEETEPIKQMRVWSRRTRAALEVFHVCFPEKEFRTLEREIKTVTGALGQARDLDVMIGNLSKREAGLPPQQRGGIASFIAQLQDQREGAQEAVCSTVAHLEDKDLLTHFQAIVEAPPAPEKKPRSPKPEHRKRHKHGKG